MKEKKVFFGELAYFVGMIILAFGTAFMERANFGLSMVVAPAYLIHLKLSEFWPFFSFGMSTYCFQAVLLLIVILVMRKAEKRYFLSFVTAFIYGNILDIVIRIVSFIPGAGLVWRIVFYIVGLLISAVGIAFMFRTYFPTEVYELLVKEFSQKFNLTISKMKTIYDVCSCTLGIALSLILYGTFVGVNWGTIVCALLNGFFIGQFGRLLDHIFIFKPGAPAGMNRRS